MKEFNFNSQVCTDRIQSERLLALGLKKETADMVWLDHALTEDYDDWRSEPIYKDWEGWQKDGIPAWSLHRLIEMVPTHIHRGEETFIREIRPISISYVPTTYDHHFFLFKEISNTYYDGIIATIEWLIKEGYFNKEYLEE